MRTRSISNRTARAVELQIAAMGSDVFEIGLFKPEAGDGEAIMVPRVWIVKHLFAPCHGSGARISVEETSTSGQRGSINSR